jgi:hypothetical protein
MQHLVLQESTAQHCRRHQQPRQTDGLTITGEVLEGHTRLLDLKPLHRQTSPAHLPQHQLQWFEAGGGREGEVEFLETFWHDSMTPLHLHHLQVDQ